MSYTALHDRYNLSAPPARTIWAVGRPEEHQRAWLPDFAAIDPTDPTAALETFMRELVEPYLGRSTYVQCKVLIVVALVILVINVSIICRRFHARSLWIVRVNKELLVPNPVSCFTISSMIFITLYLCLALNYLIHSHTTRLPSHLWIWWSLLWTPISLGVYLATLGTTYAMPDAFKTLWSRPDSFAHRIGLTPKMLNRILLLAPCAQLALVLGFMIPCERGFQHSVDAYHDWRRRWAGTTGELNRQMLLEAQEIWYESLRSLPNVCVVFLIWSITAAMLGIAKAVSAILCGLTVSRQIKTLKDLKANRSFSESYTQQRARDYATGSTTESSGSRGTVTRSSITSKPSGGQDNWTSMGTVLWKLYRRFRGLDVEEDADDANQLESVYFTREQLKADEPTKSYFPAVKPSTFQRAPKPSLSKETRGTRHYLERFLMDHLFQSTMLTVGCAVYSGVALHAALAFYPGYESGKPAAVHTRGLLMCLYVGLIVGSGVILVIGGRTYEPVIASFSFNTLRARRRSQLPSSSTTMAPEARKVEEDTQMERWSSDVALNRQATLRWSSIDNHRASTVGERSSIAPSPEPAGAGEGEGADDVHFRACRVDVEDLSANLQLAPTITRGGCESPSSRRVSMETASIEHDAFLDKSPDSPSTLELKAKASYEDAGSNLGPSPARVDELHFFDQRKELETLAD